MTTVVRHQFENCLACLILPMSYKGRVEQERRLSIECKYLILVGAFDKQTIKIY